VLGAGVVVFDGGVVGDGVVALFGVVGVGLGVCIVVGDGVVGVAGAIV
jgi:hypothetical protein